MVYSLSESGNTDTFFWPFCSFLLYRPPVLWDKASIQASCITESLRKRGALWSYCSANSSNTLTSTEISFLVFRSQHIWAFHVQDELLFLILYYQLVKMGRNAYTYLWDMTLVRITFIQLKIIKPIFYNLLYYLDQKCPGEKDTWTFCCLATAKYLKAKAINALESFV